MLLLLALSITYALLSMGTLGGVGGGGPGVAVTQCTCRLLSSKTPDRAGCIQEYMMSGRLHSGVHDVGQMFVHVHGLYISVGFEWNVVGTAMEVHPCHGLL